MKTYGRFLIKNTSAVQGWVNPRLSFRTQHIHCCLVPRRGFSLCGKFWWLKEPSLDPLNFCAAFPSCLSCQKPQRGPGYKGPKKTLWWKSSICLFPLQKHFFSEKKTKLPHDCRPHCIQKFTTKQKGAFKESDHPTCNAHQTSAKKLLQLIALMQELLWGESKRTSCDVTVATKIFSAGKK